MIINYFERHPHIPYMPSPWSPGAVSHVILWDEDELCMHAHHTNSGHSVALCLTHKHNVRNKLYAANISFIFFELIFIDWQKKLTFLDTVFFVYMWFTYFNGIYRREKINSCAAAHYVGSNLLQNSSYRNDFFCEFKFSHCRVFAILLIR